MIVGQRIYSGKTSYINIEKFLTEVGSKRFLLVCDTAFRFLSLQDYFSSLSVPFSIFQEFHPNPLYEEVCQGLEIFVKDQCDAIVAIGGGSAIDVAKCIKLFSGLDPSTNYLQQEFKEANVPLLAMPTTAGTGSESTRFAVIYFKGEKQSITHESIIPNTVILYSDSLKTLPLYQKKSTILDAFCQAIESWWSVNSTNESIEYSKQAIWRILQYKDDYLTNGTALARKEIMLASNFAGRAINISQTTAAHAMSYKITSLYKIAHGHAVALCLPALWKYMLEKTENCIDSRGVQYLKEVFQSISKALGKNSPKEAVEFLYHLFDSFQLEVPKPTEKELDLLVESVNIVRLKNNPVLLNRDDILQLYRRILKQEV